MTTSGSFCGSRLDGRVAIITGGGGGIGGAICRTFAAAGARVACLDVDHDAARRTADEILAAGGPGALAVRCDVSSAAGCAEAAATVSRELGRPTVLVNAAAMLERTATIVEFEPHEWERMIAVNLTGVYLVSRAVLPEMIAAGGGSIVHLASMHAHVGRAGRAGYCAVKGAIVQLAKAMAIDHAGHGIRVNALSPGGIETERTVFRYGSLEEARRQNGPKYLLGRYGRPDEIARAALFLASDASSYMTGTDLLVDGGYCAR